jgi:uncharacterized damage-inducible protein DinB
MLEMLRDLIAHKGYADAALLSAIGRNQSAASDGEVRALLHHVVLANRFWLTRITDLPFVLEKESRAPDSFAALVRLYAGSHEQECEWIAAATEAHLRREVQGALVPGGSCSVLQAMMQVCLHSHGHRAQCAKLLRRHGGTPPATDFILWVASRPVAEWPV